MTIKTELLAIQEADGGLLKPEAAVSWAANHQDSALHAALEWNDAKAGHAHRLHQVRQLIAINIVNEVGARQYVSLSIDRVKGGGYRDIESVVRLPDLRAVLLSDALAELERVRTKYLAVKELAAVWAAISEVRRKEETAKELEPA